MAVHVLFYFTRHIEPTNGDKRTNITHRICILRGRHNRLQNALLDLIKLHVLVRYRFHSRNVRNVFIYLDTDFFQDCMPFYFSVYFFALTIQLLIQHHVSYLQWELFSMICVLSAAMYSKWNITKGLLTKRYWKSAVQVIISSVKESF